MIGKIWDSLMRGLPVLNPLAWLDKYKTTLGAALLLASLAAGGIAGLQLLYPESSTIGELSSMAAPLMLQLQEWAKNLGVPLVTVGLIDKGYKAKAKRF